jgi:peptidylglycine monooxygenase
MTRRELIVALGDQHYRVVRPWGDVPVGPARVTDVTVDLEGRVHVLLRSDPLTDELTDAVITLAPDGTRLASWGAGLIADAHMLAIAPDGRLFIVDRDSHQILICDPSGHTLGGLGVRNGPHKPFNHPTDVAISTGGEIYVCEGYAAGTVHRFSTEEAQSGCWGKIGTAPGEFMNAHAIWLQPDGRVVVADRENDRLQVFSPDGALLAVWTGFKQPLDIWGDAEGCLFVTDLLPSLTKLAPDGTLIGRCRPVLNGAHGIWGAKDGSLLLAEGNPSRLTRLVPLH